MKLNFIFIVLLSSLIFTSCKQSDPYKKDPLSWSAAMCSPYNHAVDGPMVYYYKNGKIISNVGTTTSLGNSGWGYPDGGRSSGNQAQFPDSVSVAYGGLNDKMEMCTYEGGSKLPADKIEKLFKQGYFENGVKNDFHYITAGLAPGGRVCVWVDFMEIKRFKVNQIDVYHEKPIIFFGDSLEKIKIIEYLNHHPINYSIWEEKDPKYNYEFGLCSEDRNLEIRSIYSISKEGVRKVFSNNVIVTNDCGMGINYSKEEQKKDFIVDRTNIIKDDKMQLPNEIQFSWELNNIFYAINFVFPEDFEQRFAKPYMNLETKKMANFKRIIIGIEKDGIHCTISLGGDGRIEKIASFKGKLFKDRKDGSLKDFDYPEEVEYFKKPNG